VPLSAAQRTALIDQYARGPARLRAALAKVPAGALQWRPGPEKWSAHEVIVHCGDSETNSAGRLRYLLAEPKPQIVGYDQAHWAVALDYHTLPLEPALAATEAVRANAVPVLRRLTDAQWRLTGHHTEVGAYSVEDWLQTYAEHLEKHSGQIERNVAAWSRK
jgi:hypothetical protein